MFLTFIDYQSKSMRNGQERPPNGRHFAIACSIGWRKFQPLSGVPLKMASADLPVVKSLSPLDWRLIRTKMNHFFALIVVLLKLSPLLRACLSSPDLENEGIFELFIYIYIYIFFFNPRRCIFQIFAIQIIRRIDRQI